MLQQGLNPNAPLHRSPLAGPLTSNIGARVFLDTVYLLTPSRMQKYENETSLKAELVLHSIINDLIVP